MGKSKKFKKKVSNDTISYIATILSFIALAVYAIIDKNYKLLITLGILVLFFVVVILFIQFSTVGINKRQKKLSLQYKKYKNKANRTLFEELYMMAFTERLDEQLKSFMKKEKLKSIQAICSDVIDEDTFDIFYRYIGFDVTLSIKKNNLNYCIDSPVKYDGTSQNISFEKKKDVDIDINKLSSIDEFYNMIKGLISEINIEIDNFKETNLTDEIFNGRLVDSFAGSLKYFKNNGYIAVILGPPLLVFMIFGVVYSFVDVSYRKENFVGFITLIVCGTIFSIVFLLCIIIGVKYLRIYKNYQKDFNLKRYKAIKQKIKNISVVRENASRHNSITLIRYLVLYYDNLKLIVPVKGFAPFAGRKNMKIFKEKCLEETCNIKYLEKSGLVFDGASKYLVLMRKYLVNNIYE